jgi:hypothetical protein
MRAYQGILAAVLVALACLAAPALGAETSSQNGESGNPISDQGSSFHYRSYITGVDPSVPGLSLQVLEFADRLQLINHTGKTVTIYGYEGEPYAQVLANGTVRFNQHAPAYYLNQAFYGNVTVPPTATATAKPLWVEADRTAQLEWHDHRIHWMSTSLPPTVKNQGVRTKVFAWHVPISVGTTKGTIAGELYWVPEAGSKAPVAAYIALGVIVIGGIALSVWVRRRRGAATPPPAAGSGATEAW